MIPILYEVDETKYTHDGLGQMVDAESCVVTEIANGEFSLEMTYPKNGRLIKDIIIRRQILAKPNDLDQPHAFRIFEIDKDTSELTWTISAMSITNDESVNIVRAIKGSNKTASEAMAMIKNNLVLPSRFDYVSDIEGPIWSFENGHMTPIAAVLGDDYSMQRLYGGELKRTNSSIQLLARRGRDKVTVIRKGKNAEKVHHNISYTGKYSAILPYTTLKGLTSEEKANLNYRKKITVDLGSGLKVFLHRTQDRSVIFQCAFNLNKSFEDGIHKLAKNIPEEYCPTSTVYIPASVMVGANVVPERKLAFLIFKDGRVFVSTKGMNAKPHHIVATTEWVMSKKAVETSYKALLDHHPQRDRDTVVYGDIVKAPTFNQIKLNYIVPVDFTETDEQGIALYDTRKLINSVAKNYFKEYPETYLPTINTEVDILELTDDFDNEVLRKLETVGLFDTLDVYVPELQVDVEVMVDSYKYDSLREKNISITAVSGNIPNNARNDTPQIAYLKDINKLKDEIQKQITANDVKLYSGISRQMNQVYNTDEAPAPEDSLEGDVWFKKNELGELSQYVFDGTEWVLSLPADYGESVRRLVEETDEASRNFWAEKEAAQDAEIERTFANIGIVRDLAENAKQIGEELQNEVQNTKTNLNNRLNDLNTAKENLISEISTVKTNLTTAETDLSRVKRDIVSKANISYVDSVKTALDVESGKITALLSSVQNVESNVSKHETSIQAMNNSIASKVSSTDFNRLSGKVTNAETSITQMDSRITRELEETIAKIPTNIGVRNLAVGSTDQWSDYYNITVSTNWNKNLGDIFFGESTGVLAGQKINLYVVIELNSIVLDTSVTSRIYTNTYATDTAKTRVWTASKNPLRGKYSSSLVSGNSTHIVRVSDVITQAMYDGMESFSINFRVDGVSSGKFRYRSLMVTTGDLIPNQWIQAPEDNTSVISSLKTTITETKEGQTQLTTSLNDTRTRLSTSETKINRLVDDVSSKVSRSDYDRLSQKVSNQETSISQNTTAINLRALKTDLDPLKNRLSSSESRLDIAERNISTKVSQTDHNTLSSKVTNNETKITQNTNAINLRALKTDLDPLKNRLNTSESRLTVAENGIFETVGSTKVNKLDRLNTDYTAYKSSRSMTDSQINSKISTEVNGVVTRFNTTKETVDAFSRVIGTRSESGMVDAVARTVMSSNLFTTEISRVESDADIKARMAGGLSSPDPDIQNNPIKVEVYDNNNTGQVSITRVSASSLKNPNGLANIIKVTHHGTATSPNLGGIKSIHTGLSNQQLVVKIIASIPVGFKLNFHNNSLGTGGTYRWVGSDLGTGKFETYLAYVELGQSPNTPSTFGYFSLSRNGSQGFNPNATQKLEWYLQTYDIIDITKSNTEAVSTRVDQLANSWAVRTLNNNGDIIGQMNLTNGNIKLQGKLITLDGTSNISNAVIKDAHIQNLGVNKITGMDAAFLKARIGKLSVSDITGITASFLTTTIGDAFIEKLRGKTITATNNNAIINLNDGKITFGTDSSGIYRRATSIYTEQGMFFQQHGVNVKGVARGVSRIIIGGDRSAEADPAKNWDAGDFNGIIIETIKGIAAADHDLSDKTTIVSDAVAFQAKYGGSNPASSGWKFETYAPNDNNTISLRPINIDVRRSDISAGDFKLLDNNRNISLRTLIDRLFHNVQELANRSGKGRTNLYWDQNRAWSNTKG